MPTPDAHLTPRLKDAANIRRVEMLYARLPASTITVLMALLLSFALLFGEISMDWMKAWAAFMLSGLGMRVWLWYMFRRSEKTVRNIGRWEWLFAGGVFISSIGWAALAGPLFPHLPESQALIALLLLMLGVAATNLYLHSRIGFWTFVVVSLTPLIGRFALIDGGALPVVAGLACIVVFALTHHALYGFAVDHLQRHAVAESLLDEQQAIFQSSPMGIAVVQDSKLVKCNSRLGELLGRSMAEMTTLPFLDHFVSRDEAAHFMTDCEAAFSREFVSQGVYRLKRADHSEFWAEAFGRRMPGPAGHTVWMFADVTMRVAQQHHHD